MSEKEPPKTKVREARPLGEPIRFGSYLLQKRIAVGGMSEVYLAKRASGRGHAHELVIKRLLPSVLGDPRSRSTFEIEANLHAAARHPNVVEVFEAGEVDGEPYLAMEYVPGVDAFRLMRRAQSESRRLPPAVAIYVARELCKALDCVHGLKDESGKPYAIVHRDVTPSNVYLSVTGAVKLGDFGIARSFAENTRATGNQVLKGKYGYLSPEQVSGEPFDYHADLFSLAVVLAEMLIGQSLFPGAGQLAVLLAIRDCRIDPLRASKHLLEPGLFPILEKALAKAPGDRFQSAMEIYHALARYEQPNRGTLEAELSRWVKWAGDPEVLAKRIEGALRESGKMTSARIGTPLPHRAIAPQSVPPEHPSLANVRTQDGRTLNDVPFAKLVEYIVTGELVGGDEVSVGGASFQRIETLEVLARHLPPSTATTSQLAGPGIPDYVAELSHTSMLEVLGWLFVRRETGALFAERTGDGPRSGRASVPGSPPSSRAILGAARKELYFESGRLILVASSEPSELLGEYLVRQGAIDRTELEMALLALPRYEGRLGDTLIGLGMVDPVEVFRAIQSQGRSRVADIFRWPKGRASFYRGVIPQRVDFRLDLDAPDLAQAGLEQSVTDSAMISRHKDDIAASYVPVRPPLQQATSTAWAPSILHLIGALGKGLELGALLVNLKNTRKMEPAEALRALEISVAMGLVKRA
jgi:eukaryotic-like serine/threonine-protein kinase